MRIFAYLVLGLALFLFVRSEAYGAELTGSAASWARSVQMRVPGPAGPAIVVSNERCPGIPDAGGCWIGERSELYVRERDSLSYLHELGHAFDDRNLDDLEREILSASMGFPRWAPWQNALRWSGDVFCERIACPNERFADVYAYCSMYPPRTWRPARRIWVEGWWTTRNRLRDLCWLIGEYA